MRFRLSARIWGLAVAVAIAALPLAAHAQTPNYSYLYRVANFTSYLGAAPDNDATRSDRYFTSTGFQGLSFTMDAANIGQFRDGQLRWNAYGTNPARTFNWADPVPVDLGFTDNQPWDPDRPDFGSALDGETNDPKTATLTSVFEGTIINRIMDGEAGIANAYLDLYFGNGAYVQSDGVATTPELVLLERGGNSGVYLRAIRSDYSLSNTLAVNIRSGTGSNSDTVTGLNVAAVGGSAGFSVDTMEIGNAQAVYGTGIDLMAFGNVSASDRIIGYQIWFETNSFCDGPDLHSFILSKEATEVPEAGTLAALSMMLAAGGTMVRLRRGRA